MLRLRLCYLLALLIPTAMCYFLTHFYLGAPPEGFVPSFPNDLAEYWHEVLSFKTLGLNTGYYSYMEALPQSDFRMAIHGPLYPIILGSLAKIFGWESNSPVFYNLGFITFALAIYLYLVRPKGIQVAVLIGLLITFWPIHLYIPSAFQEPLHDAFAIILAALAFRYLAAPEDQTKKWTVAIFVLLIFLSILRFSWSLFLVPVFFSEFSKKWRRPYLATLLFSFVAIALMMKVNSFFVPPESNTITGALAQMKQSPLKTLSQITAATVDNMRDFLNKSPLEFVLRVQILLMVFVAPFCFLLSKIKSVSAEIKTQIQTLLPEAWLHSFLGSSILFSSVLLYWDHGYYRVFSVVFVFSCFLILARARIKAALAIVVLNLIAAIGLAEATKEWIPNFAIEESEVSRTREALSVLKFDPEAKSPWCNTIVAPIGSFDYRIGQAPPGFGLSNYNPLYPPRRIKSKYVLLRTWDYNQLPSREKLKKLFVLPDHELAILENTDSLCPSAGADTSPSSI